MYVQYVSVIMSVVVCVCMCECVVYIIRVARIAALFIEVFIPLHCLNVDVFYVVVESFFTAWSIITCRTSV